MVSSRNWLRLALISMVAVCCLALEISAFAEDLTVYAYRDFSAKDASPGSWAIRLNFNAPVFPSNLNQALTVSVDGKRIGCEISPVGGKSRTQASRAFRIIPQKIDPAPETIVVKIKKGLSDVLGAKLLASAFVYEFQSVEEISIKSLVTYFRSIKDRHADEYEANKHFFLSHYFRDNYDQALKNMPVINSGININRIEVWVTNKNGNFTESRNVVAFMDLAEGTTSTGTNIFNTDFVKYKGPGRYPKPGDLSGHALSVGGCRAFVPGRVRPGGSYKIMW